MDATAQSEASEMSSPPFVPSVESPLAPSRDSGELEGPQKDRKLAHPKKYRLALLLAIVVLIVLVILVPVLVLAPAKSSNACDHQAWFGDYNAESLDEILGIRLTRVSDIIMTMSEDGSTLAVAAPEWGNHVRIVQNLGSELPSLSILYAEELDQSIARMVLSGNGDYLLIGSERSVILLDISSGAPVWIPKLPIGNLMVSDVAMNVNGTIFAVAYGSTGFEDERTTDDFTVVFERRADNGVPSDWAFDSFPTLFRTTSGASDRLAMNRAGDVLIRSSDGYEPLHYATGIIRSATNGTWRSGVLAFPFYDLCEEATSDVALSSNGSVALLATLCRREGDYTDLLVVTVDSGLPWGTVQEDYNFNTTFLPSGTGTFVRRFAPMSVHLSGNGQLTLVSLDGVGLVRMSDEYNVSNVDTVTTVDTLDVGDATAKYSVTVSEDASVIAFAMASARSGGSVCLYQKL